MKTLEECAKFFTAFYRKPYLSIPSSIPVSWLSYHTAVRLDLRLLLSSSCFHTRHPAGMEGKTEGGVRSKAASFSHSLPLSLSPEPSAIHPSLLRFSLANL